MSKKGFTLVELLTAIIITGVLVAMAVPMYEKTIEKSRMAEVRVRLSKLFDSKIRVMTDMSMYTYNSNLLKAENLDISFPCVGTNGTAVECTGITFSTKDFSYSLNPSGNLPDGVKLRTNSGVANSVSSAVCAKRLKGENAGTVFLYLGDLSTDESKRFYCNDGTSSGGCERLGMTSVGTKSWC